MIPLLIVTVMAGIFNRVLLNVKHRSKVTLRAWSYQFESIVAQRSRRIQQLVTFYQRVYGTNRLTSTIMHLYRKQLRPPLSGIVLFSAVGVVSENSGFDWAKERLSVRNFDICWRDIEFIDTLATNELCPLCQEKQMKYCYCNVGNKKSGVSSSTNRTPRICRTSPRQAVKTRSRELGSSIVETAENSPWLPYFSKNEFSIWKREEKESLFAYKVYARFDDVTAADLLHVQTDLDYRRQWDETAVALQTIEEDPVPNTNSHLIYWEMRWPKLFSNRDYVYCRRYMIDEQRKVMLVCSRGTRHPKYPEYSNKVRVTDYWSFMVIKPFHSFYEPGVHYILTYFDDPGLPIPQSIKSWVTQQQMPEFLSKMYIATKTYSCKRALEMRKMMDIHNFSLVDNDYKANTSRSSWLRRVLRERQSARRE